MIGQLPGWGAALAAVALAWLPINGLWLYRTIRASWRRAQAVIAQTEAEFKE